MMTSRIRIPSNSSNNYGGQHGYPKSYQEHQKIITMGGHGHGSRQPPCLGIHFGHYIAAVKEILTEKINRLMATIPMITGISPQRWRHALNVMLEKVAGNCSVEKLRIIMLFEADFNNNNKWLGRAVMRNAKQLEEIAPEQYGSRSHKAAGTQCLNKRLFYNYIQAMHIPAALCSNDAKS